jgi:PilZ domain
MQTEIAIDERRKLKRHACDLRVTCTPCANGSQVQWAGRVVDLSLSGIRLALERRFEAGTLLRIWFRNESGEPLASLLGRVIHVNAGGEGKWLLGCAVAPQLTAEGLAALLLA